MSADRCRELRHRLDSWNAAMNCVGRRMRSLPSANEGPAMSDVRVYVELGAAKYTGPAPSTRSKAYVHELVVT